MSRIGLIHLACLYGPLVGSGLLAWWLRPSKRFATGLLFSLAWVVALLPWLDGLARMLGLWVYHSDSPALGEIPLALYLGWSIAWGLFAPLLASALGGRMWICAALMVAIDLRAMPEMYPVLELGGKWWIGEFGIAVLLLVPSLLIARWTDRNERLEIRCLMLVSAFGGIFLGIPLLVICGNLEGAFGKWEAFSPFARMGLLLGGFIFTLPGLSAVRDLALSGGGTPVPLDPPLRLVTHGIYAYVRNPMQLSMTGLLLLESLFVGSAWPAVLAAMGVIYSEGLAKWSEGEDMVLRFGPAWSDYYRSVRSWLPRWQPRIGASCELWIDGGCGPCSEVAGWFEIRNPQQLKICDARQWNGPPLSRITWRDPVSGRMEAGVAGIAMTLQHLNLPWAVSGWLAGLPIVSHILQICLDVAGAGKRQDVC